MEENPDWARVVALAGFFLLLAPAVLRMNRQHVLVNIAIWLAIVAALVWGYQAFSPGAPPAP